MVFLFRTGPKGGLERASGADRSGRKSPTLRRASAPRPAVRPEARSPEAHRASPPKRGLEPENCRRPDREEKGDLVEPVRQASRREGEGENAVPRPFKGRTRGFPPSGPAFAAGRRVGQSLVGRVPPSAPFETYQALSENVGRLFPSNRSTPYNLTLANTPFRRPSLVDRKRGATLRHDKFIGWKAVVGEGASVQNLHAERWWEVSGSCLMDAQGSADRAAAFDRRLSACSSSRSPAVPH